jgi:hypothetical protein
LDEPRRFLDNETFFHTLLNPVPPVKGDKADATYPNLDAFMSARGTELGASGAATEGAEASIEGVDGRWFRWEVPDGEVNRFVEDFVSVGDDGSVTLARTYRSRPQKETPPPAEGGQA